MIHVGVVFVGCLGVVVLGGTCVSCTNDTMQKALFFVVEINHPGIDISCYVCSCNRVVITKRTMVAFQFLAAF